MRDKRTLSILAVAAIAIALSLYAIVPAGNVLTLTVMDVGEGQCLVIRTPTGQTMVVDCGTSSWRNNGGVGESIVLPYLMKCGVRQIDVAVLTHPHDDHVSGFPRLLKKCPPKMVLDSGSNEQSPSYDEFLRAVKESGATYRVAERGQILQIGEDVTVEILSPPESVYGGDPNDCSIVLRVVYGNTAFMLTGDADESVEADILGSGRLVKAQVLMVGHHGSSGASSPAWLGAVRPQIATISCGRRNVYGHPARQTLDRLESCGARVYRTDLHGAVTITSDGSTIRVSTVLKQQ